MRAAVRAGSRPFAQTVYLQSIRPTRANASEPERTLNLAILATDPETEPGLFATRSCAFSDTLA
jgi:hypothetical protein